MDAKVVSVLRDQEWWEGYDFKPYFFFYDQLFGVHLSDTDVIEVSDAKGLRVVVRTPSCIYSSGFSTFSNTDERFAVKLTVSGFRPEELEVRVAGRFIVIHGKHEEREDAYGFVSREFTRKYKLPNACDREAVSCALICGSDGDDRLKIIAKKKQLIPQPEDVVVRIVLEPSPHLQQRPHQVRVVPKNLS